MIITRTPLRIPLGGGGTDLPSFFKIHGSFFITATINHYIYVTVTHRPIKGIRLGYSDFEEVSNISKITHPITKATLKYLQFPIEKGLEIVSFGDLPAGGGLGSSGSFTVGLINSLTRSMNKKIDNLKLAKDAAHINMDILKQPSGLQDELAVSFGGISCFEINKAGKIKAYPLKISQKTKKKLENNLLMFYTGLIRKSEKALSYQNANLEKKDKTMTENLQSIQDIGYQIKYALEKGDLTNFAELLDKHWNIKRKRSFTSNDRIDKWYRIAKNNGAIGGKIMGAGGGGFFLFYCEKNKEKLKKSLLKEGLEEVDFTFEDGGTKVILDI